ncbi:MAG: choice-of-anchor D domain-containing protein, partial [Solirubrobacteraceae bacterium]
EPALTPSTTSLELGSTPLGKSLSHEITFKNTGNTTLEVKGVQPPSAPFAATGLPTAGTKVTPGETITVNVTFKSSVAGEFSGSLGLTTQAGETTVALSATAEVVPRPELTASTKRLELGSTLVGEPLSGDVTLKNTGNTTLEVKSTQPPSAPFGATGLPATSTKLTPGETITIDVTFASSTPGEFEGSLSISTEAGKTTVALSASATAAPATKSATPAESLVPSSLVTPMGGISPFTEAREPLLSLTKLQILTRASRAKVHAHALVVTYTLSAAGTVKLVIDRVTVSHRCLRGARTCDRWIRTKVELEAAAHAGSNSDTLSLAGLAPGTYRLGATPIARSGAAAATWYIRFDTVR